MKTNLYKYNTNTIKKKLLLLFAALATAINASAYDITVGVITYSTLTQSTCTVKSIQSGYSGSVTIPVSITDSNNTYSVTQIQMEAFKNCKGLTSVTIPNSVTTIGEGAFYGCTGLTSATIGNSVTSMGKSVFSGCSGLTSVTIGSAGTTIPDYAFQNDSSLTSVTIPTGVTSIGTQAFNNCSALTSVTIPERVKTIGKQAFYGCKLLTSVVIPDSVTSISDYAFNSCSDLKEVISLSTSVPSIGSDCFSSTHSSLKIKVPGTSIKTYREATKWSDYASKIQAISLALTDAVEYICNFDFVSDTTTYTRNFTKTDWQALFLPFAMSYSDWSEKGTVAELTGVNAGVLEWTTLGEGSSTVAGKPYIFKPSGTGDVTFSVNGATLKSCATITTVAYSGYTLSGTYTTKNDMGDTKAYALSNGNFYSTNTNDKTLKPYRIYLTVPTSSSQAAQIRSRIDGLDVTGIEDVDVDIDVDNQQQFNILGQPVGNDYKGIVIINGKKVIRK